MWKSQRHSSVTTVMKNLLEKLWTAGPLWFDPGGQETLQGPVWCHKEDVSMSPSSQKKSTYASCFPVTVGFYLVPQQQQPRLFIDDVRTCLTGW